MDTINRSNGIDNEDPIEAFLALNMGDFVTEHLISDDLLGKISQSITSNPDRLKKQLEELIEIYSLDNTLSLLGFNSNQGFVLFDSMAMSLAEMLHMDACHIFQTVYKDNQEEFLSLTGTSISDVPSQRWNIGYGMDEKGLLVLEAFIDGYPVVFESGSQALTGWKPIREIHQEKVQSFIAVPLQEGQKRLGFLLFESYEVKDFPQEVIDLAEATGRVLVVSFHLQRLLDQAKKLIRQAEPDVGEMRSLRAQLTEAIADLGRYQQFFVESLSFAIDARNDFSRGHSQGVAQIAREIAEQMKLNEKTCDLVYYAGLVSSLGKISVPHEILSKEESLTDGERQMLKTHPNVGVGLLMKMNFLAEVIPYVDYQKERWDGKDSQHGLSGRSIPIGARIVAVADAFHALTNPRPYRESTYSQEEALGILQSEAGTKWDPDVVESLLQVWLTSPEKIS